MPRLGYTCPGLKHYNPLNLLMRFWHVHFLIKIPNIVQIRDITTYNVTHILHSYAHLK